MDAYERALQDAGGYGKFQIRYSMVYNFFLVVCTTVVYMNIVMVLTVPPHYCRMPPMPIHLSEESWKKINLPLERDSKGHMVYSSCRIYIDNVTNETSECTEGYEYDRTWYRSTAASDNDWVCADEHLVVDAFAYSRVGEIVGSITLGWLGDKYGRKVPYIIGLALMISGRAITAFSSESFLAFIFGALITALASIASIQSIMIISMEITDAEKRANIVMIQNIGWATGITVMPFIYWWLGDWFPFLLITSLSLVPFFMLSWQLIESPRWLWTMGRKKESLKHLKSIAKENGRKLKAQVERDLLEESPGKTESNSNTFGPFTLFSSATLALNTLSCVMMWYCSLTGYVVITMTSGEDNMEGNPFLRFAGQGFAEIPGYLLGAWFANNLGRRFTSCMAFGITAISQIIWILTIHTSLGHNWFWATTLLIIGKLCVTAAFFVSALIITEVYPTSLRQSGLSLGTVFSGIAYANAPYIAYLGRNTDARLPGLIIAILSIIGGLAGSLLPETLNVSLPETLEEAKKFGKDRRKNYFKLPQKIETRTEGTKPCTPKEKRFKDFSQQIN